MFDLVLKSSLWDDFNKCSNIGFGEEIGIIEIKIFWALTMYITSNYLRQFHSQKEQEKSKNTFEQEEKMMVSAWYNLVSYNLHVFVLFIHISLRLTVTEAHWLIQVLSTHHSLWYLLPLYDWEREANSRFRHYKISLSFSSRHWDQGFKRPIKFPVSLLHVFSTKTWRCLW